MKLKLVFFVLMFWIVAALSAKAAFANLLINGGLEDVDATNRWRQGNVSTNTQCGSTPTSCYPYPWLQVGGKWWQKETFYKHGGSFSGKLSGKNFGDGAFYKNGGWYQTISVSSGSSYTISGWVQRFSDNGIIYIGIYQGGFTAFDNAAIAYYRYDFSPVQSSNFASFSITTQATSSQMTIYLRGDDVRDTGSGSRSPQNDVYFDDIDVSLVPARQDCNATSVCGACVADPNTCNQYNGQKACTYTTRDNSTNCNRVAAPSEICTVDNCSAGTSCRWAFGMTRCCPNAGTCPAGACQTTTASRASGSCTTVACSNYCATTCSGSTCCEQARPVPACRTSDGSVPDGSCGTTPYTRNCTTSCSGGSCQPQIDSLQIGNNSNRDTAFTSPLRMSGLQSTQNGKGWYNPMTITLNATRGTGTISDYYVAFYNSASLLSTSIVDTSATPIPVAALTGLAANDYFVLKYTSAGNYYVWDKNSSSWFNITGGSRGKQICAAATCTAANLYYTAYAGDALNWIAADLNKARTWTILLDKNLGSKTFKTAVSVVDSNNQSAFNSNINPTY